MVVRRQAPDKFMDFTELIFANQESEYHLLFVFFTYHSLPGDGSELKSQ